MFEHPGFRKLQLSDLTIGAECTIISDRFLRYLESEWLKVFQGEDSDDTLSELYTSGAVVEAVGDNFIDITFVVDWIDRRHFTKKRIAQDDIVACIEVWNYERRPYLVLKDGWINTLINSNCTTLAFFDAIGVKQHLQKVGSIRENQLIQLKKALDQTAARYRDTLFLSVADSVIMKAIWTPRMSLRRFAPELALSIYAEVRHAFKSTLGCEIYGIFTQGPNDFGRQGLVHKSIRGNHIGLNILGAAFADIFDIDTEIKANIRSGRHEKADVYLEKDFLASLHLNREYREKLEGKIFKYRSALFPSIPSWYCIAQYDELIREIEVQPRSGSLKRLLDLSIYRLRIFRSRLRHRK